MTDTRLLPCPSCARHVRASEDACPFCSAALPAPLASQPMPRSPGTRLSRAALFAFGTSAAAIAACGGSTTGSPKDDVSMVDAAYGGPPRDGAADADNDSPFVNAAYGGPPFDASLPDAADASDSGQKPDGIAPPYGAPP